MSYTILMSLLAGIIFVDLAGMVGVVCLIGYTRAKPNQQLTQQKIAAYWRKYFDAQQVVSCAQCTPSRWNVTAEFEQLQQIQTTTPPLVLDEWEVDTSRVDQVGHRI